jgi:hypothetical protein
MIRPRFPAAVAVAAIAVSLLLSSPSAAQPCMPYPATSAQELLDIMEPMGPDGEDGSEGGVNTILRTIGTVFANLNVCPGCESIKFRISAADADFTAAANARNSDCRSSRSCIAQDGGPVPALNQDLDLAGGAASKGSRTSLTHA